MRNLPKLKLLALLLALVAFLAIPAAANATLTYTKGTTKPKVYIAENNGKGAKSIGAGRNSRISPDGETVIYERETNQGSEMRLYSVAAKKSQRLLNPWSRKLRLRLVARLDQDRRAHRQPQRAADAARDRHRRR